MKASAGNEARAAAGLFIDVRFATLLVFPFRRIFLVRGICSILLGFVYLVIRFVAFSSGLRLSVIFHSPTLSSGYTWNFRLVSRMVRPVISDEISWMTKELSFMRSGPEEKGATLVNNWYQPVISNRPSRREHPPEALRRPIGQDCILFAWKSHHAGALIHPVAKRPVLQAIGRHVHEVFNDRVAEAALRVGRD